MDREIEELKRLIQKNIQLTEDTNRIVHKIRRGVIWGRIFQILWWGSILAISGVAYYYYLQPYVDKILELYSNLQAGGQQAQNFGTQISSFFGNWAGNSTNTPQ